MSEGGWPQRHSPHAADRLWDDRFLAWLVEILLVGAIVASLGLATGFISVLCERIILLAVRTWR
jgi:hypothetical protein